MKKKHGWVLEMCVESVCYPGFYQIYAGEYAGPIKTACVYSTRAGARYSRHFDEIVRKVSLTAMDTPEKVIPGR
ncbi:hypothetical protein LCGC14_2145100 [marine sediment metagenome]|uniref:Uncharacterized protein n=1 Tax=marine sediment metagenome TaxID=412755 RepID=A0A0F9DX46_9ZZZZ